jgi:hypothetical protein
MNRDTAKPDVAIDEVQTNLEITDAGAPTGGDLRKLITALVKQCLREERDLGDLRDQDTRITDRAWRPNRRRE